MDAVKANAQRAVHMVDEATGGAAVAPPAGDNLDEPYTDDLLFHDQEGQPGDGGQFDYFADRYDASMPMTDRPNLFHVLCPVGARWKDFYG